MSEGWNREFDTDLEAPVQGEPEDFLSRRRLQTK